MSCPNLLSNLINNKTESTVRTRELTIENNLTNFSNSIKNVLSCAQKIIPGQGEAVVFEKPNFDSTGKVYFFTINSDNTKKIYSFPNITINSMIIGPFTTLYLSGTGLRNYYPYPEHKANEKIEYYAQVTTKEKLLDLPQTPIKVHGLTDGSIICNSAHIYMSDCFNLCDDGSLQSNNGKSCLSGYRKCVSDKIGGNSSAVLDPEFLIECERKYFICQKDNGIFPGSNDYNKDYSKLCNPDPKKQPSYPRDESCYFVNKNDNPKISLKRDAFYNLFYFGTFFDLCESKECKGFCSTENWQKAWNVINEYTINLHSQTKRQQELQIVVNELKSQYNTKKMESQTKYNTSQSNLTSYQKDYQNFLDNMSKLKEQVVKEIQINLQTELDKQKQRVEKLKSDLDVEKNNDIISANSQFLIREEDYKNRLSDLEKQFQKALTDDENNRKNLLNDYDKLQKEGELTIKNAQSTLEKTLNEKLNNFVQQNLKDIDKNNEIHNSSLSAIITKATVELEKINTAIKNETQAFEAFKVAIEDKMKAIQVAADQTDLLYEKEIDRLNGILQMSNDNNKKTIKDTQSRYDEQIVNLLKLSDAEKKIILQDKNTTVENKMDFLIGKQDLISQDFQNKKSILESQYEMAIAAQDNLFNTQLAELKKNNDKNISDLINVANNYKNTISETQSNLTNLQQTYNDRTIKLNNDIKKTQEEGVEKIKKLISDNEEAKIKLIADVENKTSKIMQELDDKVTEQQKRAIDSKIYYARELEKLLVDSENKRIELINNNTKELESSLNNLEIEYKNKSKDLDVKISELQKNRDIIQEESALKLNNVNKIITQQEEYKTVYVKTQYKAYSIGLLLIINIILLILKIKK
jgi:hypothetical protein